MSQMPPRGRGGSVRLSGPRPLLPLPPDSDQHPPEPGDDCQYVYAVFQQKFVAIWCCR